MNPSPVPEASPPLFAQPWAVRLGFALLVGFTLIVGLTFSDHSRRTQLETSSETTAVGDVVYFAGPDDPTKLPVLAARLNGKPLFVLNSDRIGVRDTHLTRVGKDPASGLSIYQHSPRATLEERARLTKGTYLLKTGTNEYARAQELSPGK
ncbi:MAG: hypothetical protein QOE70_4796 [Chthoniobacter sp.]|jgi:hypothetical protein|nr:hypothetical protein [Chthoniobacter sp.]